MKYEVIYKIVIQVDAEDENEAHQKADDELLELIHDKEKTDHYYLMMEIARNVREIKVIEEAQRTDK